MNKRKMVAVALFAVLFVQILTGCGSTQEQTTDDGKLSVVASFYTMADFTEKIGGDRVAVTLLIPNGTEPHDWEPGIDVLKTLSRADAMIINGLGMEEWSDAITASSDYDNLTIVVASDGTDTVTTESSLGHHESEDPHVWLSPLNAMKECENIKDALSELDPDGAEYYQANYDALVERFEALDEAYREGLSQLENTDLVVNHAAYAYICDNYGLNQIAIEGLDADQEPNAARLAEIVDYINENDITVIFTESMLSQNVSETLSRETGVTTEVLNPLEGLTDEEFEAGADYFSVMEANLETLVRALK